jgi:4-amino-4-deoxy-L-arabinose transferase-like glycosyltransferase
LTRAEAVLLLGVLVIPLLVAATDLTGRQRVGLGGLITVVSAVVIAPWAVRNLSTFDPATPGNGSGTIAGANCDRTYEGPMIGLWTSACNAPAPAGEESAAAAANRRQGLAYIAAHRGRVPVIVAVRVARVWQAYGPLQGAQVDRDDGRPAWANHLSLIAYVGLLPLAGFGALEMRRRREDLSPLIAQLAAVSLTAALVWGAVRFRAPAEVVIVVLAGIAIYDIRGRSTSRDSLDAEGVG